MKRINLYILLLALTGTFASCKKFLDEKPDKRLKIPTTVEDYQALLDGSFDMNLSTATSGILSADDYYQTDADFNGLDIYTRNLYTWETNSIADNAPNDWSSSYGQVYNTNIALEGLDKIAKTGVNGAKWDNVKGSALFYRGRVFLEAATLWAKAYDNATASTDLGIPLKMTSNFDEKTTRASVKETYDRILLDLKTAANLLPVNAINNMRPSKAAAYAYLSRAYLSMRDYPNAGKYADSALLINNTLLDYQTIGMMYLYKNPEVVMVFTTMFGRVDFKIPEDFYNSYASNDNRKSLFFDFNRDGSIYYSNTEDYTSYFTGIANDELYLTRAECFARAGNTSDAMKDLNTLLKKRISRFVDLTAADANAALRLILTERRKELLMRGTRWMDLKRLNKEPEFKVTLKRVAAGKTYELLPDDAKYALPIPSKIVSLAGIPQNPR